MAKTKRKIVLIVEDDEVLLRALYLLFHNSGYTIASATDGDSALKMTERLHPDLVLLDLLLPKMNGFDVLRNIKVDPKIKDVPVIVLSNLGDQSDIDKAKTLGALDYYVKANTELSSLEDKIKKILE
ncbi:MAG: response regulator [Candidatus Magasanikbacteria bacterium]|nr:response regulator [Candidatus Magasanikbacteria bacterium]